MSSGHGHRRADERATTVGRPAPPPRASSFAPNALPDRAALQRSGPDAIRSYASRVGNRAASQALAPLPVQRYRKITQADYNLALDPAADRRQAFTRQESKMTARTDPVGGVGATPTGTVGWARHFDATPDLNVADDNSLAINATAGEPKEFYARPGVVDAANAALLAAASPIELTHSANVVTIPLVVGDPLRMVQPKLRNEAAPGRDEFISLGTEICRDVALKVLGGNNLEAILRGGGQSRRVGLSSTGQAVSGTNPLAKKLAGNDLSLDQATSALGSQDEAKGVGAGEKYGKASRPGGDVPDRAEAIGVNKGAKAQVGEGYVTQSIANSDRNGAPDKRDFSTVAETIPAFSWGYHFSSVVASSTNGADQIAMENYRRSSEVKKGLEDLLAKLHLDFAAELADVTKAADGEVKTNIGYALQKLQSGNNGALDQATARYQELSRREFADIQRMWYFRMIGSLAGQSFHEQMAGDGFFINPLTMVVGAHAHAPTTIDFAEGSEALAPTQQGKIDGIAAKLTAAARANQPLSCRVVGYASGWKGTGIGSDAKSLARANAVRDALVTAGVDVARITAAAGGKHGEGRANRMAKVTFSRS